MERLIIGCGYLGQRVAARWLEAGDRVSVLTRSAENAARFEGLGMIPFLGDVLQPDSLVQLPAVDTVLWAVGWDRSSGKSQQDVYVNGLENVLRVLTGRCSRLISISSTSVYGQSAGEWVDESTLCQPDQPNGQTCLTAEELVRSLNRTDGSTPPPICRDGWPGLERTRETPDIDERKTGASGVPSSPGHPFRTSAPIGGYDRSTRGIVLRLSGIYGPGRLLSRVAGLRSGEPLSGNPDAWLNLIHVEDAAEAVLQAATIVDASPLYLISDNEPMIRRDYYSLLAKLVAAPPPRFEDVATSPGAPVTRTPGLNKRCSNLLARTALAWNLKYPTYREGLPQAVDGLE